ERVQHVITGTLDWALRPVRLARQLVRLAPDDASLKRWHVEAREPHGWTVASIAIGAVLSAPPASVADLRALGQSDLVPERNRVGFGRQAPEVEVLKWSARRLRRTQAE